MATLYHFNGKGGGGGYISPRDLYSWHWKHSFMFFIDQRDQHTLILLLRVSSMTPLPLAAVCISLKGCRSPVSPNTRFHFFVVRNVEPPFVTLWNNVSIAIGISVSACTVGVVFCVRRLNVEKVDNCYYLKNMSSVSTLRFKCSFRRHPPTNIRSIYCPGGDDVSNARDRLKGALQDLLEHSDDSSISSQDDDSQVETYSSRHPGKKQLTWVLWHLEYSKVILSRDLWNINSVRVLKRIQCQVKMKILRAKVEFRS